MPVALKFYLWPHRSPAFISIPLIDEASTYNSSQLGRQLPVTGSASCCPRPVVTSEVQVGPLTWADSLIPRDSQAHVASSRTHAKRLLRTLVRLLVRRLREISRVWRPRGVGPVRQGHFICCQQRSRRTGICISNTVSFAASDSNAVKKQKSTSDET